MEPDPQFLSYAHIVQKVLAVSGILQIENKRLLAWPPTLIVHPLGSAQAATPAAQIASARILERINASLRAQTTRLQRPWVLAG